MYYNFFNAVKLTAFIIFWCTYVNAQDIRLIDSLSKVLESTDSEKERVTILISLSFEYFDVDDPLALQYADDAYLLAMQLGDSAQIVKSGRLKGQLLRRLDKLNESIEILTRVYPIAKRHKYMEDYKRILNALAVAYTFKADYDKALDYNFQSLVIRESEGNKAEISIALNNIGLVYFKLKNYENATEYYKRSLALKREANDSYDLDRLLINLGLCYNQLKDYKAARGYFDEGFRACMDSCSSAIQTEGQFGMGVSFYIEADIEKSNQKFLEAEAYFLKSTKVAKDNGDKRWQIENAIYLAHIYTRMHEYERANETLIEAEQIAAGTEYNLLVIEIYKCFSTLFNQTKNFQKAAFYQQQYIKLKDSIYSEALIKNLALVQSNYEERKNIATIASKEVVIKQQRDLTIAVLVIALLTGLLVLVLQRSNRTIKKVNAQLSEAKGVIQEQNTLLESKNKFLDKEVESKTEDLERANQSLKQVNDELDNFIYKTSHDIRGPLASLKGMCNVALMDVKDAVALDYLRKLDTTAERLNTILTRLLIINQINNSKLSLSKVDFSSIVKDVLLLEKKKGLPQKLSIHKHIEDHVYIQSDRELIRIVLENLIDNAIKFYNDSERVDSFVEVKITSELDGHVKVRVVDNGIGISESNPGKLFRMFFRASERSETGGIGLYIVKTATAKLGGRVGLLTTPEGYTEFYVVFPPVPPNPDDGPEKPSIY